MSNVVRVAWYRLGVKLGLHPVRRLQAGVPNAPFFLPTKANCVPNAPAVSAWYTSTLLFSHLPIALTDAPPDWLANPLNNQRIPESDRDWWQIPDFDSAVGDIKLIWELSRMDWALAFAQRASQGDMATLKRLNEWMASWCAQNPPYKGPNWKCGQEASIRVMHLAMAALIMGQIRSATSGLLDLIRLHLQRIAPTVQYAMAQDNNHGTSEAAALFIGGSWLDALGFSEGNRWANMGRFWLENRSERLIGPHGSFSQYSLNYHRVMLDTFCMVEVWRQKMGLTPLSTSWMDKALVATEWLRHMLNKVSGDGPNAGANDGARLLPLTNSPYRDYRPTVQLAMVLFAGKRAYLQTGSCDTVLQWLRIDLPLVVAPAVESYVADDGGFALLRRGNAMVMLRYPRFRFRPSQADALHLDLWLGADNLLRDGGTYSYNTEPQWLNYFGGTASHNTVQFDGRDQMPRLSRFLLGDWLKTEHLQPLQEDDQSTHFAAGYCDGYGARHRRCVSLENNALLVVDEVQGFADKAVLRWRLMPGDWHFKSSSDGARLMLNGGSLLFLNISSNAPITRCELVKGWESRHYLEKTPLPILELEIQQAGTLTTQMLWTA
ncbi:heparinase II/III family protein [Polynucleobacter sp. HIN7]|uniref:heparinase II/III family protein n=1 Tax=Polynucleobacter sp. HIN7 TaxID=3047866 RepID=UPI002573E3E8|nr:heparinase II/III-family protein [Polynucleobacter sp. HIN7]